MTALLDKLLQARSVRREFLNPNYEECLDSFLLPDMEKAVRRIEQACERKEKILIYGDYDVDGVTASTLMKDALRLAGAEVVEVMLPNRFKDGYGMSEKCVERARELGVKLVVTVDCGSRNHEIIEKLSLAQIDVIITDHHECGETLPKAVAVVNPKRKDQEVPAELEDLAGVGVAFKLAQALVKRGLIPDGQEKWLLDLVVIGTICDNMRISGENRRLTKYGMKVLAKTRRPGLRELLSKVNARTITGETIGFQIGPRLNAAGRMETAEIALKLLGTTSRPEAAKLAEEVEELNKTRKSEQRAALIEIRERGIGDEPVVVVKGDYHEGVIGIIAGKLMEEYRRPAFVFTGEKGSGRSFGDFNLAEALAAVKDQIIGGGGHAEACGVKVAPEKFEDFKKAINDYYRKLGLKNQEKYLAIREDLVVRDVSMLDLEFTEELKALEPFGNGNQEPIFLIIGARVMDVEKLGAEGQHLRLMIWDKAGRTMKLIWFYAPEKWLKLEGGETLDVWLTVKENEYNGIRSVEGRIVGLSESML